MKKGNKGILEVAASLGVIAVMVVAGYLQYFVS